MAVLPADPRIVQRVANTPKLLGEQKSTFLSGIGGSSARYSQLAKVGDKERDIYSAIEQGMSNTEELEIATGLTKAEIDRAIKNLQRSRLIEVAK